jgi:hypothetical protein
VHHSSPSWPLKNVKKKKVIYNLPVGMEMVTSAIISAELSARHKDPPPHLHDLSMKHTDV